MPRITASPVLSRFRVLDVARVRAGSTCVRFLADFGADVIRVEPPRGVDPNDNMFATKRLGGGIDAAEVARLREARIV